MEMQHAWNIDSVQTEVATQEAGDSPTEEPPDLAEDDWIGKATGVGGTDRGFPFRFATSRRSREFHRRFFPEASPNQWNDWRWQIRNRIRSLAGLARIVRLAEHELAAFNAAGDSLPLSITPYYASLIDAGDATHAIRRCVVPTRFEWLASPGEADDPLGEDAHSPVPGLVHRYPDRVLFLATGFCSTYCRYCTRSRLVGRESIQSFDRKRWQGCIEYIERTPAVRDVLISGGDPLTLPDEALEWLLSRLRKIRHVEFIRIGTKVPAVLPQRVTKKLVTLLHRYHPLWMSLHFTHPEEITPESTLACSRLADAGLPLGSQTVLLQGINDDSATMRDLVHGLLKIRVRPYYLYQCDPITGSGHFRTPVRTGLDVIRALRGHTSGYAVPNFVIDTPGGGGKIPLLPEYLLGRDGHELVLRNYEGREFRYHDPMAEDDDGFKSLDPTQVSKEGRQ